MRKEKVEENERSFKEKVLVFVVQEIWSSNTWKIWDQRLHLKYRDLGGVVVIATAEVVIQWSLAITRVMGSMEKTGI